MYSELQATRFCWFDTSYTLSPEVRIVLDFINATFTNLKKVKKKTNSQIEAQCNHIQTKQKIDIFYKISELILLTQSQYLRILSEPSVVKVWLLSWIFAK